MRYVATRFIDRFRPGDEIPDGWYEPPMLGSLLAKGHVVGHVVGHDVASDVPPEPVADVEPAQVEPARVGRRRKGSER